MPTNNGGIEKWSSMTDVREHLNCSREAVLKWINKCNMPAHKVGKLWKFRLSEVDEWILSGGADERNYKDADEDEQGD